jgi:hypothetical protein
MKILKLDCSSLQVQVQVLTFAPKVGLRLKGKVNKVCFADLSTLFSITIAALDHSPKIQKVGRTHVAMLVWGIFNASAPAPLNYKFKAVADFTEGGDRWEGSNGEQVGHFISYLTTPLTCELCIRYFPQIPFFLVLTFQIKIGDVLDFTVKSIHHDRKVMSLDGEIVRLNDASPSMANISAVNDASPSMATSK